MATLQQKAAIRYRKKLDKKLARLDELRQQYQTVTNDKSRASFKGKITRCEKDIEGLQACIKRLESTST